MKVSPTHRAVRGTGIGGIDGPSLTIHVAVPRVPTTTSVQLRSTLILTAEQALSQCKTTKAWQTGLGTATWSLEVEWQQLRELGQEPPCWTGPPSENWYLQLEQYLGGYGEHYYAAVDRKHRQLKLRTQSREVTETAYGYLYGCK